VGIAAQERKRLILKCGSILSTHNGLREAAPRSELVHMDETGWKVEAQLRWLWAVVTDQVTFCEILPGRGFAQAASILGAEYAGWLIHNDWRV
jgi:transposase